MIRVSIIIPTYNRKNLIGYTLDSLAPEKHPGLSLEIIVVDDHSTDRTIDYIRAQYPNVKTFLNTGNGAQSARNIGVAESTGKYLVFLDSDDLLGENYLVEKIRFLEDHKDVDASYGRFEYFASDTTFSSNKIIYKIKYPINSDTGAWRQHLCTYLSGFYLPLNSVIWRKSFVDKVGLHDVNLSINQDVEYIVRALLLKMKIAGLDDSTFALVRSHNIDQRVGSTNNEERKYAEILQLRHRIYDRLQQLQLDTPDVSESLSIFLFNKWREIRMQYPRVANDYLTFAKQVFWPIKLKGGLLLRVLSAILGPVKAVKVKAVLQRH